jgi:tetratricopeptide (TPR) repeat protein
MKLIMLSFIFLLLSACENIAVLFTPQKKPTTVNDTLTNTAENTFWQTLHQGNYNNINNATRLLMAAYLNNPNDPKLAAHLGFLHIWQLTERYRKQPISPGIVDNIILSKNYFSDAVQLAPEDARYLGFLGDSQLVAGKIFNDEREQVRGYFTLKKAIRMWPEFNYFTAGYVMSSLPFQSDHFKEGLAWQWATLDLCAMQPVSRKNPDFSAYLKNETEIGPKRACWNSWIAPYNFEGFFLNMGDMLVKAGDWQTAIKIYRNATLAKNYQSWPYRQFLQNRIANAKNNVAFFQNQNENTTQHADPNKMILFNSGYGCVACHQKTNVGHRLI